MRFAGKNIKYKLIYGNIYEKKNGEINKGARWQMHFKMQIK